MGLQFAERINRLKIKCEVNNLDAKIFIKYFGVWKEMYQLMLSKFYVKGNSSRLKVKAVDLQLKLYLLKSKNYQENVEKNFVHVPVVEVVMLKR